MSPAAILAREVRPRVEEIIRARIEIGKKAIQLKALLVKSALDISKRDFELQRPFEQAVETIENLLRDVPFEIEGFIEAFLKQEHRIKAEEEKLLVLTAKWREAFPALRREIDRLEEAFSGSMNRLAAFIQAKRFYLMGLEAELNPSKPASPIAGRPFDFQHLLPTD